MSDSEQRPDKDHVFARFERGPDLPDRREQLTVRGRAGATGTRTVQVVHVRSGRSAASIGEPRLDRQVRAATWEHGFPTKPVAPLAIMAEAAPAKPVCHVMPAPARILAPPAILAPIAAAPRMAAPAERPPRGTSRRVADPFDAEDDGANCMRCGYAVEAAREKRGLLTCARCG